MENSPPLVPVEHVQADVGRQGLCGPGSLLVWIYTSVRSSHLVEVGREPTDIVENLRRSRASALLLTWEVVLGSVTHLPIPKVRWQVAAWASPIWSCLFHAEHKAEAVFRDKDQNTAPASCEPLNRTNTTSHTPNTHTSHSSISTKYTQTARARHFHGISPQWINLCSTSRTTTATKYTLVNK